MAGAGAEPRYGAPIWAELVCADIDAATGFYRGLFGWTAEVLGVELGGYRIFRKHGAMVAGGMRATDQEHPPAWFTYFAVPDVDAFAERVRKEGGTVTTGPVDVLDLGRTAALADPSGAEFCVWQPGTMGGAEMFNEPGAQCWSELATRDPEGSRRFYTRVFGWWVRRHPHDQGTEYTEWYANSEVIGGLIPMLGDQWPAGVPPHWMVYFAVEDCDAAVETVTELGGQVEVEPFDIHPGRVAVVSDPDGAHFSVIALNETAERAG